MNILERMLETNEQRNARLYNLTPQAIHNNAISSIFNMSDVFSLKKQVDSIKAKTHWFGKIDGKSGASKPGKK